MRLFFESEASRIACRKDSQSKETVLEVAQSQLMVKPSRSDVGSSTSNIKHLRPRFHLFHLAQEGTALAAFACTLLLLSNGCHSKNSLPPASSKTYVQYVSAFYTGLAALQVGDDVRAESSLTDATRIVPAEPAGWVNWGVLALRQRSFDTAAQRLGTAKQLAPESDAIDYLQGVLESDRGNSAAAISDLRDATRLNPRNLKALYLLASETERQGDTNSEEAFQQLISQILTVQPDNLAALVELSRIAAKRGDTRVLQPTVAKLATLANDWPAEATQQLSQLQSAAASSDPRSAATRSTFLRNVLMRVPKFRSDLADIKAQPGEDAEPLSRFLRLENTSSQPAPPDMAMSFNNQPVNGIDGTGWKWIGAISMDGSGPPAVAVANGHEVRLTTGASLPFPGGSTGAAPSPEGVLAVDFNYDFKTDLILAGAGGVRLFRQEKPNTFTDVTSSTKLPKAVANASYTGAWAVDIEADGDLDVVLGSEIGIPQVLRNNGDGTFDVVHPFSGVSGIRQFVWVDLNGDGNPDAAIIDGSGRLRIFLNQRSGNFRESSLPGAFGDVRAIASADIGNGSSLSLVAVRADGSVVRISYGQADSAWQTVEIAHLPTAPAFLSEDVRLHAADLDNNGAVDLVLAITAAGSNSHSAPLIWLQDDHAQFRLLQTPLKLSSVFDLADIQENGRVDLLGISADGNAITAANRGSFNYHWQTIRPRARVATGDQRINSFGIGGEIEVRSGLLVQKQPITRPELHFGLGEHTSADVARIVWPNGSVRAEFGLKSNQQIVTEQRLKGSCPFLFAWNGSQMQFVKDSVPWGSAIGLRINSLGTARVEATEEWYKIGAGELKPRDGFYDLRITGELWESYYYDHLRLMTVDHPAGTEVFTDERFDVPPVKLAITAVGPPQPIARAVDDNGQDVTATLASLDGKYLDTFGRGQYQGVTRDHFVEIDLGDKAPATGPLWLIAKGWLHPADSSINIAMSQGHHDPPRWLSLEVPDGRGGWKVARPNLGFPAGRKKICLIDLANVFVPGTPRRLRLRTNLEVFWDSIEWAQGLPSTKLGITDLAPSVADLHYRGFSTIHQADSSSPEIPDYNHLSGTAQRWRDLEGYYTRFGDVRELLKSTDDRYVVMNAGDELSLRFPVPPPPPSGWVRDFVIAGDGWIKDGDYNSSYSQTVLPYPYHARKVYDAPPGRLEDDWVYQHHKQDWQTYQTRYVSPNHFETALRSTAAR